MDARKWHNAQQKVTLQGPDRLRLVLDRAEIVPNDPGAGTPAMVYLGTRSATYGCACDTGELDGGEAILTPHQVAWLQGRDGLVYAFLHGQEV